MDRKLDLYNAIIEFQKNSPENDNMLFIYSDSKTNEIMLAYGGDIEIIVSAILTEPPKSHKETHELIKDAIINTAFNIIATNETHLNKTIDRLIQIKNNFK